MKRETGISERIGCDLSLLAFDTGSMSPQIQERFIKIAVERCRSIDFIGQLSEQCLGIALLNTDTAGATILAEDICDQSGLKERKYMIYRYPTDWELTDRYDESQGSLAEDQPPSGPVERSGKTGCTTEQSSSTEIADTAGRNAAPRLNNLRILLAQPLPRWKRVMDIIGAASGLILLMPLLLSIGALIRCVTSGPVLFTQERIGFHGKRFRILKFTTMYVDAPQQPHEDLTIRMMGIDEPMTKLETKGDPRIIPWGNVLRVLGIDELPQLINVLRGEMSLVGPRPSLPYEVKHYRSWQARRLFARPGITGLWQVSGKNPTTFTEMIRHDISYTRQLSPLLDARILARTFPVIAQQAIDFIAYRKR